MHTLEEAWTAISKVKNDYNRNKLIEIYHLAAEFIPKFQNAHVSVLLTPGFAQAYLPLLRKIIAQTAGKKFIVSYTANPWIGLTRSVSWYIWLPTRVGSRAAMTILKSYVVELELQANGPITISIGIQTDPETEILDQSKDQATSLLVPITAALNKNVSVNDTIMTSGIGCGNDGFSSSDGEMEEAIQARAHANLSLSLSATNGTPSPPQLNSTAPPCTPSTAPKTNIQRRPRKLTKGSRQGSFRDSGLNLTASGAWEEDRDRAEKVEPDSDIDFENELVAIELSQMELSNHDAELDQSWEEIPEDEIPDLE